MFRFNYFFLCSLGLIILFGSCKKEDNSSEAIKEGSFSISGIVLDELGTTVSQANILVEGKTVKSGNDGRFIIQSLEKKATYRIEVQATNYFSSFKNVLNLDNSPSFVEINLLKNNQIGTLPSSGGTVGSGGLKIISESNAFQNKDGSVFSGSVKVSARYIRQNDPKLAELMPGGDFSAENGSSEGMLISYGFVASEYTDGSGNTLIPVKGKVNASITMPGSTVDPFADGAMAWGFDKTKGKWTQPSMLKKVGGEIIIPASLLFTNIDKFILEFGFIEGLVKGSDCKPASNVRVEVLSNLYDQRYVVTTNTNGKYKVRVVTKIGTTNLLYNVKANGISVTTAAPTNGGTITAPEIVPSSCGGTSTGGTGKFTVGGVTYSGNCYASLIPGTSSYSIGIVSGISNSIILEPVPSSESGSFPIVDILSGTGGITAILEIGSSPIPYGSKSGTLTKTGVKSFTFSCTVVQDEGGSLLVTGNGSW